MRTLRHAHVPHMLTHTCTHTTGHTSWALGDRPSGPSGGGHQLSGTLHLLPLATEGQAHGAECHCRVLASLGPPQPPLPARPGAPTCGSSWNLGERRLLNQTSAQSPRMQRAVRTTTRVTRCWLWTWSWAWLWDWASSRSSSVPRAAGSGPPVTHRQHSPQRGWRGTAQHPVAGAPGAGERAGAWAGFTDTAQGGLARGTLTGGSGGGGRGTYPKTMARRAAPRAL